MRPSSLVLTLVLSCLLPATLRGQAPNVTSIGPRAVQPGRTTNVTLRGQNLADVSLLWTSFAAETTVDESTRRADSVTFAVNVPADAAKGLHGIRVVGPKGVSPLRLFVVDDLASVARAGNNDAIERAQVIETPIAVDGHVDALRTQFFRFHVEAGAKLSFEVLARRFGSPLDPLIRLLDATGNEITYSDDEPGLVGDARLRHEFTTAGDYLLEVRDVRYQGGGGHFYRLRVGDFPCIDTPVPMAATVGTRVALGFAGPHVEGLSQRDLLLPKTPGPVPIAASFTPDGPSGFAVIRATKETQSHEQEPNDDVATATNVETGAGLNGVLGKPGDVDHFRFTAGKGSTVKFGAITRREGSAADLFLRLLDESGKQLATAEDTGTNDGTLTHAFTSDGEYVLAVEDLHHRGGPRYAYRIAVEETQDVPFTLAVAADHIHVPTGGVGVVTVNATRGLYKGTIALDVLDLPAGLSVGPAVIGSNLNTAVLTIRSDGMHDPIDLSAVRIVGRVTGSPDPFTTTATVTAAIPPTNGNVPYPPALLDEAFALAVTPVAPFSLSVSTDDLIFGPQLGTQVKVVAHRREGFDEEIALAIEPAKEGLPANVTPGIKPIPKGASEVTIGFTGTDKAPLGQFSVVVRGTLKQGNATHTAFTPAIGLTSKRPFLPQATGGRLKPGGELKVKIDLSPNAAIKTPIAIKFEGLPPGVTVARTSDAAADGSVEITLKADDDAKPIEKQDVTATASTTIGKTTITAKSAPFTVTVEP